MVYLIVLVISYLVGSIPNGLIIGKLWRNIDIREHGSGNIGTTNMFRVLGTKPAVVVLVLDTMKGIVGVVFGQFLAASYGGDVVIGGLIGGVVAILGHMFTIFLRFKGGKGVATGLGVLLMIAPVITLIVLAAFIVVVWFTRYVSLGSIVAAILTTILMIATGQPLPYVLFILVAASFIIIRHYSNIKRLLHGQELKIKLPAQHAREE